MTARRCQLGPARKPNRGADALQPDLAVDPPERLRCLTMAVEEARQRARNGNAGCMPGRVGGGANVYASAVAGVATGAVALAVWPSVLGRR